MNCRPTSALMSTPGNCWLTQCRDPSSTESPMAVISWPGIGTIGGSVGGGGGGQRRGDRRQRRARWWWRWRSASPRSVTLPRSSVTTPARSTPAISLGRTGRPHQAGDDDRHHRDDGDGGPALAEPGGGPDRRGTSSDDGRAMARSRPSRTGISMKHVRQLGHHEGEPDAQGQQAPTRAVPGRRVDIEVGPGQHEDRPVPQVDAVGAAADPHQRRRAEQRARCPAPTPVTPGCTSAAISASVHRSSSTKPPR